MVSFSCGLARNAATIIGAASDAVANAADNNNIAYGYIAQWLERLTADQQVPGSNPGVPLLYHDEYVVNVGNCDDHAHVCSCCVTFLKSPATRNRTKDNLMAANVYSQMLYQLSYSRLAFLNEHFASQCKPHSDASFCITICSNLNCRWPRGPMDKASAYGAGDCRFESCRGHFRLKAIKNCDCMFNV